MRFIENSEIEIDYKISSWLGRADAIYQMENPIIEQSTSYRLDETNAIHQMAKPITMIMKFIGNSEVEIDYKISSWLGRADAIYQMAKTNSRNQYILQAGWSLCNPSQGKTKKAGWSLCNPSQGETMRQLEPMQSNVY